MFEDLEWNPDLVPPLKLGLHLAQILFAFIIFCLEIAVFRDDKSAVVGQNGWTFGVVRPRRICSYIYPAFSSALCGKKSQQRPD